MFRALPLCLLLLYASESLGNVAASYFACEGLADGDRCRMTGPFLGRCTLDTLCEEDPDDPSLQTVNECLLCVDECWSRDLEERCVIPWTGERGVCAALDDCTPDPEKSFLVCQACLPPSSTQPSDGDDGGCRNSMHLNRHLVWLGIVGLLLANLRRMMSLRQRR